MTVEKRTPNQSIFELIMQHRRMTIPETILLVNEHIKKINETEIQVFGRARTPKVTESDVKNARMFTVK
jgi:hypothetical protein